VAGEVRDPRRNIVRALLVGTVSVSVLYVLVNGAFLSVLGFEGMRASTAVATDTVNAVLPGSGGALISGLICISALGALNGLIFTGARISFAVGADHRLFRLLGRWSPRTGTPVFALLVQGVLACGLVVALGSFLHAVLYTAAAVYTFYLATTLAVIVLRRREPQVERPYRLTGYPFTPILFASVCAFLVYSAVVYKPLVAVVAFVLLLSGAPLYWLGWRGPRAGGGG
jgi:amino acid transporter